MTQNTDLNLALFERAKSVIPGGVNSPVRAFAAVGGTPRFVQRAQGAYFWDQNQQQFTDYIGSWGPMILGHGHPEVVAAVQAAVLEGFSYGAPTEREVVLAEKIRELMPSMDMVRMVSSGTEAGMSALRLARGFTGRNKIIKFNGCYHGHADALLVKAGSGLATFGASSSAGVPADVAKDTVVLEYNDVAQLEEAFAKLGNEIACVIMEPIAGNMNFVRATVEFTRRIRELTREHGALMIYDEVMTGFRVALGGAQSVYAKEIEGFAPDITVMGKVIGGGMPMAAFGARREIMEKLSPLGPVYQAGTLSGNPIATACGLKTLELISRPGFHADLHLKTGHLMQGLKSEAKAAGIPFAVDWQGGLFGFYFLPELPKTYAEVMKTDGKVFNKFYHGMLERGHY
ncbi:MAG: glutamate-1-semialdehyde 2,1-aminomutase, partial [Comamonas sp.]|nr:glutamate-1-semialdehyde 2,1-aminomutase [Comamonas sp.]